MSKTRLAPPLTATEAAELSACFVRDTAANIASIAAEIGAEGVAVYTPVGAEEAFDSLIPQNFYLLAQRGELFGDRLSNAVADLLATGYESVCLIDSDSPTLPPSLLRAAVAALAPDGDRLILGPATDGGYYLIGLKKTHRHLFTGINWSTSSVLAQTIERAAEIELEVEILPAWYDVDDAATLSGLCDELFSRNAKLENSSTLVSHHACHTRRYLSRLIEESSESQRIWTGSAKVREVTPV